MNLSLPSCQWGGLCIRTGTIAIMREEDVHVYIRIKLRREARGNLKRCDTSYPHDQRGEGGGLLKSRRNESTTNIRDGVARYTSDSLGQDEEILNVQ